MKEEYTFKNWNDRINDAVVRGYFTSYDVIAARGWPTCACGEQDPRIPRKINGAPEDMKLLLLGARFSGAVANNQMANARQILIQIEQQAAVVLQSV